MHLDWKPAAFGCLRKMASSLAIAISVEEDMVENISSISYGISTLVSTGGWWEFTARKTGKAIWSLHHIYDVFPGVLQLVPSSYLAAASRRCV